LDGQLHREDGPAVVYEDGTRLWLIEGNLHRADGPAIIYEDGEIQWWLNGIQYTEDDFQNEIISSEYE
jgi:hypothetical protein